jgi:hypothetical protein
MKAAAPTKIHIPLNSLHFYHRSTLNTLKYLYHHMKFGIFCMIHDGALRIFAPFVNVDYRNTWAEHLRIEGDGSLDTYYSEKSGRYREEQIELDRSNWWANGNIMCNELTKLEDKSKAQHWGDHFLAPLRDMLAEACRERKLPDCEFFLIKRDYPQIKVNVASGVPVEPYGFIFDKDDRDPAQDVDLFEEHKFLTYAPVVSFYAAAPDRFTDIPFPSSEGIASLMRDFSIYRGKLTERSFTQIGSQHAVWCFRTPSRMARQNLVTCSPRTTFVSLNAHGTTVGSLPRSFVVPQLVVEPKWKTTNDSKWPT